MLDTNILLKYHSPSHPSLQCFYSLCTDKKTIDSSLDDPLFGDPYSLISHLKLNHPDPSSSSTHLLLSTQNPSVTYRRRHYQLSGSLDFTPLYNHNFAKPPNGYNPPFYLLVTTTPVYTGPAEQSSLLELFSSHPAPKKLLLPDSSWPTHYINKTHRIRLDPPFHVHSNKELGFTVISTSATAAQRALTISRNIHLSIARLRLLHCDIPSPLFSNFLSLSHAGPIKPPSKHHWVPQHYDPKSKHAGSPLDSLNIPNLFVQREKLPLQLLSQRRLRPHYLARLLTLRPWLPYLAYLSSNRKLINRAVDSPWDDTYNPKSYPLPTNLHDRTTHPTHFASNFLASRASSYSSCFAREANTFSNKVHKCGPPKVTLASLLHIYITTELAATLRLYKSLPYNHPLRTISHLHLPPIQPLSLDLYLPPHLHSPSNVFPCPTTPPTESNE